MATQSGPEGDWHRTWQAIHHQPHVAISLSTPSCGDLCACERTGIVCVCVCVCVPVKMHCPSRTEQKLQLDDPFQDHYLVAHFCELERVNEPAD